MTASLRRGAAPALRESQKNVYDTNALAASGVVKATPAVFFEAVGYNNSGSTRYFQMFDSTTVPIDTTVPDILPITIPANGYFTFSLPAGVSFANGLAWCSSSTLTTKTVTGSPDMWVTVTYK